MKIVTDSSVMYSITEGAERGMSVCPLSVSIEDQSWIEYEEVSSEEFLKLVRAGAIPRSASPPVQLTLDAWNTDEEIVHICMAHGLSGTYEVACSLRDQAKNPDNVHIVNSKTLCAPHRVMVNNAIAMAKNGATAKQIVNKVEELAKTAHSFLIPEDFDFLRRGGRLTPLAAKIVTLAKAFPVMRQTDDGCRLEKHKIALSYPKAIKSIIETLKERGVTKDYLLSIAHADNPAHAEKTLAMLKKAFPENRIEVFDLSPAFITQGGPGCLAVQCIDISSCPNVLLR